MTTTMLDGPLVNIEALAAAVDAGDPALRIADCRWYLGRPGDGRAAYDAGHLPGAIHLDIDTDLTTHPGPGRHPLPDPATFAARLASLGIGDAHVVVAYDDVGGWVASRLWWMLDDLGHSRVVVLDGGLPAWTAAGLPLTRGIPNHPPATLTLAPAWRAVIEREALQASLGTVRLLDARAGARYRGEVEPIDAYPGHIPSAINAPTDANLGADGRFLPPDSLAARYRDLGADGAVMPTVVSCGSGVSATHDALAIRLAGLTPPLLYPGSYSDWTQAGLPVVTGDDPGAPSEALRDRR